MLDGREIGAGVVLGNPNQGGGEHKAHSASAKQAHLRAVAQRVVWNHGDGDKVKRNQAEHASHDEPFIKRRHDVFHLGGSFDKEAPHNGRQNRNAA